MTGDVFPVDTEALQVFAQAIKIVVRDFFLQRTGKESADLVMLATESFTRKALDRIKMIVELDINAKPGLHTMLDLPVPSAIMGDMREQIDD